MADGVVYSTDHGRMCPGCDMPVAQCLCRGQRLEPAGDGMVRIYRETKGRGGKAVTVVTGVPLRAEALLQLSKRLKHRCGSGGTLKNGVIEIQGDHRTVVVQELRQQGFTVKLCGG